jgi:hypothetical protein
MSCYCRSNLKRRCELSKTIQRSDPAHTLQVTEDIIPTNNHTMYALIVTRNYFNFILYRLSLEVIGSRDEVQVA